MKQMVPVPIRGIGRNRHRAQATFPVVLSVLFLLPLFRSCSTPSAKDGEIGVLILSGRNNHDWEKTTAVLTGIFEDAGGYAIRVTTRPDTLDAGDLRPFDAVVSNWNSWPENDLRWPEAAEEGLMEYLEGGGGLVFFHASTSVFYEWPEFSRITTAAWVEGTHHGPESMVRVEISDRKHPVTQGLSGFYTFDELWIDAGTNPEFRVLGTASPQQGRAQQPGHTAGEEENPEQGRAQQPDGINRQIRDALQNGTDPPQPAIFAREHGNGRIFHTILGHDEGAMRNTGFRTLILRGTEWAATGNVRSPVPRELSADPSGGDGPYTWQETDTTVALLRNGTPVWRYNTRCHYGKPFFHPVSPGPTPVTWLSPEDHPWHLGQWFSWKFINGINYWEFDRETYRSDGVTEVQKVEVRKDPDHSAEIALRIAYHPRDGETVLLEERVIRILAPEAGRIVMDYDMRFEPVADRVRLDRTPIEGEPDGKSWGGYAGLSIRFSHDMMDPHWISSGGSNLEMNRRNDDWLFMGFSDLHGKPAGSAVFIHPGTRQEGAAWYLIDNPEQPFYYFSPAILYLKPITMERGDTLRIRYRVLHLSGETPLVMLKKEYEDYTDPSKLEHNRTKTCQ